MAWCSTFDQRACRFGDSCGRPGCRFLHPRGPEQAAALRELEGHVQTRLRAADGTTGALDKGGKQSTVSSMLSPTILASGKDGGGQAVSGVSSPTFQADSHKGGMHSSASGMWSPVVHADSQEGGGHSGTLSPTNPADSDKGGKQSSVPGTLSYTYHKKGVDLVLNRLQFQKIEGWEVDLVMDAFCAWSSRALEGRGG